MYKREDMTDKIGRSEYDWYEVKESKRLTVRERGDVGTERPWCWVWTGLEIGNGSTCSYSSSICGNTIERPSDMPNQDIKSVWANSISNMVRLTLLVLVGYVARSLCSLPIFQYIGIEYLLILWYLKIGSQSWVLTQRGTQNFTL